MSDEPAKSNGSAPPAPLAKDRTKSRVDVFITAGLVVFVVILFAKTVFAGVPISKVHVIAEWDSIFKNYAVGKSQLMDPSLILLMVPYYLMVGRLWHCGEVPLWNSFSGFGAPLLADPQALGLSILHLPLALFPTIATYNLTLVLELAILVCGAFVFGRSLGLTRIPSVFLGVTLLCCPYEQWYLELLGNGYCLIPFLLAAFLNTARRRTIISAAVAGVTAALVVLSAHPELSFCSITVASILLLAMVPFSLWRRGLLLLLVAGAVAFCLSAPMLLPFVEFLVNSDSYKFGNRAPAYYPWQTLAFNLIQPGYGGASPNFGVLAALVFPLGLVTIFDALTKRKSADVSTEKESAERQHPANETGCSGKDDAWALRACVSTGALALMTWAISAKVYPLGMLLTKRPLSYVVVTYFFPVLLVLVAGLAAFGLERALSIAMRSTSKPIVPADRYRHFRMEWPLMAISLGLIFLFPIAVRYLHINLNVANFDMTLPGMEIINRDWIRNGLIACALLVLIRVMSWVKLSYKRATIAAFLLVVAGLCSQLAIVKGSLPKRPPFSYPLTETISKLKSLDNRRMIATGEHTLRPNTNLVYDIRDARCHNPIFPRRFLKFMEKAGAELDVFNQVFSNDPSKMLDVASIAYVVTTDAPLEKDVFDDNSKDQSSKSQRFKLIANNSEGMRIYENTHAVPDAYIVRNAINVETAEEALEKIADPNFDALGSVVLEGVSAGAVTGAGEKVGTATISRRANTVVCVQTESSAPGFLVLTDLFYPGWEATIDGAGCVIHRANYAFRAIELQAGKHTVEFRYRPVPFYIGVLLSIVAAGFVIGLFVAQGKRPAKQSSNKDAIE